jgi:hypothetical protein
VRRGLGKRRTATTSGARARLALGLLLAFALLPAAALAQTPADLALRAATIHDRWCSDVAAGQSTEAATAMVEVTPVLRDVSRVFDETNDASLLYWRGMLNQCLSQDERAIDDLEAFIAKVGEDEIYSSQVKEAKRRLRRLTGAPVKSSNGPAPEGIAVGASLLSTGGVLGGLSGWQNQVRADAQAEYDGGMQPWAATAAALTDAQAASGASRGLLGGAIAGATAGIGALVVTLALTKGPAKTAAVPLVVPTEGGAVVGFGGRW